MKRLSLICLLALVTTTILAQNNASTDELRKLNSELPSIRKSIKQAAPKASKTKKKNKPITTEFIQFNSQNSNLWMNSCTSAAVDSNNIVWVGTLQGIAKVESDFVSVIETKDILFNGKGNVTVSKIIVDNNNNKWFLLENNIVCKYDNEKWITYDATNSPLRHIFQITSDTKGNMWFCTNTGLQKFDGKSWTSINSSNSKLPDNQVMAAFVDSKNRIWVGTKCGSIMIDGNTTVNFQETDNPLKDHIFSKAIEDTNGNIWFSLVKINKVEEFFRFAANGLANYTVETKWNSFNTDNSEIPANEIFDITADRKSNSIWCNIENNGIVNLIDNAWQQYVPKNSMIECSNIYETVVDKQGNLWCATDYGLLKIMTKNKR